MPDTVETGRGVIKRWVVMKAVVSNPYDRYWSASVTIGYDLYGKGETIEGAYNDLTDHIFGSNFLKIKLVNYESFKKVSQ